VVKEKERKEEAARRREYRVARREYMKEMYPNKVNEQGG